MLPTRSRLGRKLNPKRKKEKKCRIGLTKEGRAKVGMGKVGRELGVGKGNRLRNLEMDQKGKGAKRRKSPKLVAIQAL